MTAEPDFLPPDLAQNLTVQASAGSGKTYLLVSRVLHLLLTGASPGSILAITFTRKAAAEMYQRVIQRLQRMATCSEAELQQILAEIQIDAIPENISRARGLYEQLLRSPASIRTTTFHAFCQDLLRRFPLEADVPPGFELRERMQDLLAESWEALMVEAARHPASEPAAALRYLFDTVRLYNTRTALHNFIAQRSDWWAYTQHAEDPVSYACQRLQQHLALAPDQDPLGDFLQDPQLHQQLRRFHTLLGMHPLKTHLEFMQALELGLQTDNADELRQQHLIRVFLTGDNQPRKRSISKTLQDKLGEHQAEEFIQLHEILSERCLRLVDQQATQSNYALNQAWFTAGAALLHHYQRIKAEQRLLDFSDLEWKAYQLLNHSDNALWVQYKLDERINHLLVDEFQDTNPTQWHLLLPLLDELAQNPPDQRSVFLVGDAKQSIYRFRRAEPRLFAAASHWLEQRVQARAYPLNVSWRSSPAIINFVNRLFGEGHLASQIPDFVPHRTHLQELWGEVVLLPASREYQQDEFDTVNGLRNPLLQPRPEKPEVRYIHEAHTIVSKIQQLFERHTLIGAEDDARPLRYADILLLIRSRTHLHHYEQALRAAGLPYLSGDRGTLLDSIEVQDMLNLLQWLTMPFDNLALAGILRSPLFAASDDELMLLARGQQGNWYDHLSSLIQRGRATPNLQHAYKLLESWLQRVGSIPVHDLLDRIYSDANALNRYMAAFPDHLANRVTANLTRFLELALEMDSGRYPSLMGFAAWLKELHQSESEAPDEPASSGQQDRIRIMTIHSAKGLEAPIVFLADTARDDSNKNAYQPLTEWPVDQAQPELMLLRPPRKDMGSALQQLDAKASLAAQREDANLLYVALTRARQLLFISGSQSQQHSTHNWYQLVCTAYQQDAANIEESICLESAHQQPARVATEAIASHRPVEVDPRLSQPLQLTRRYIEIAPSQADAGHAWQGAVSDEDGKIRGIVIHQLLEWLCQAVPPGKATAAARLLYSEDDPQFTAWWQEALQVYNHPELAAVFQPGAQIQAYNELPLLYQLNGQTVHGVIDRLLVTPQSLHVIDYKTHQFATPENVARIAATYQTQMQYYADGLRRLWPQHNITASLLFTACAILYPMQV